MIDCLESKEQTNNAYLNLVYSAKFLGDVGWKLREEGIKVGYHIFVALQDLWMMLGRSTWGMGMMLTCWNELWMSR